MNDLPMNPLIHLRVRQRSVLPNAHTVPQTQPQSGYVPQHEPGPNHGGRETDWRSANEALFAGSAGRLLLRRGFDTPKLLNGSPGESCGARLSAITAQSCMSVCHAKHVRRASLHFGGPADFAGGGPGADRPYLAVLEVLACRPCTCALNILYCTVQYVVFMRTFPYPGSVDQEPTAPVNLSIRRWRPLTVAWDC
jgi:hypothetical protein